MLLRLLARAQPIARLQPLRDLFCLTLEKEALFPPFAFDSHCHIDQIRADFCSARSASILEICAQVRPDEVQVVSLGGVIISVCDPEAYSTPEEVRAISSQGCYVVVGLHP